MGGRTNNAGDWLTGKSQAQFDKQAGYRKANADLLRKSGYRFGIDESTGEQYDFRARAKASGNTMYSSIGEGDEEAWKGAAENYLANTDKDPFSNPKAAAADAGAKPKPVLPDATDDAIKKARQNAWSRLQLGKNQQNSFATKGTIGSFDVSKPILGGY